MSGYGYGDGGQRPGDAAFSSARPGYEGSLLRRWLTRLPFVARRRNGETTLADFVSERGHADAPVTAHERALLSNILKLRDITAADVMVPRADITAVEINTPLKDLARLMSEKGHSRLPVFRRQLDDTVGIVHIKDVIATIASDKPVNIGDLMNRNVVYVSPSMRVLDLMLEMQLKKVHIVLVVDEFGGLDGIVTVGDLIEEIVGEVDEGIDPDEMQEVVHNPDGTIDVDARLTLEEFEGAVGDVLSEDEREDIDTMGGLVFLLAGHMPARGEVVKHASGLQFQVLETDPRRIKRVRVLNIETLSERAESVDAGDA